VTRAGARLARYAAEVRSATRSPAGIALIAVFAAGVGVRVWFVAEYRPAFLGYVDSWAYVSAADSWLFQHVLHPAGYPLFLRFLHDLNANLSFTILVQHALGVAAAALLYLAVRRGTGSRWLGLIPAAVVLFAGLQLFLEHTLLTESLFTALVAGAVYAGIRAFDDGLGWAVLASALAVGAGVVRTQGLLLVPFILVCIALGRSGPWRSRVAPALAGGVAAAVLVIAYLAAADSETNRFAFSSAGGRAMYARVAPFADCARFTPPAGARALCERVPPDLRRGTNYYLWDESAPAARVFGAPPRGEGELRSFARASALGQPGDYLSAVGSDLWRFAFRDPPYQGPADWIEIADDGREEAKVLPHVTAYYTTPPEFTQRGLGPLASYGRAVRIDGVTMVLLLVLPLVALGVAQGRRRWTAAMLTAAGLVPLLAAVAVANNDPRYAAPALGPLAGAAAIGVAALILRARAAARSSSS
jgi:hypothetical protein